MKRIYRVDEIKVYDVIKYDDWTAYALSSSGEENPDILIHFNKLNETRKLNYLGFANPVYIVGNLKESFEKLGKEITRGD